MVRNTLVSQIGGIYLETSIIILIIIYYRINKTSLKLNFTHGQLYYFFYDPIA